MAKRFTERKPKIEDYKNYGLLGNVKYRRALAQWESRKQAYERKQKEDCAAARQTSDKQTAPKPANKAAQPSNQWRNEPGTSEPLRVGRAMRTRDDKLKGQKGKNIHPEQPADELYRRVAALEIGKKHKIALVQIKRPNSKNGVPIPNDAQNRKYIPDILTKDCNNEPIRLKNGCFELAPSNEDLTEQQVQKLLSECEKKQTNKTRMEEFRKASKKKEK